MPHPTRRTGPTRAPGSSVPRMPSRVVVGEVGGHLERQRDDAGGDGAPGDQRAADATGRRGTDEHGHDRRREGSGCGRRRSTLGRRWGGTRTRPEGSHTRSRRRRNGRSLGPMAKLVAIEARGQAFADDLLRCWRRRRRRPPRRSPAPGDRRPDASSTCCERVMRSPPTSPWSFPPVGPQANRRGSSSPTRRWRRRPGRRPPTSASIRPVTAGWRACHWPTSGGCPW